ncbi:hypothetical protein WH47_07363 [Habropoda laboriosa]|uniref:Uncharacterized protein n=1 Tax=Habropoda laboriosa TaxID=597456 RepID=A0A0L7R638_9HYME|nr:hypothetical protein WH47_07363 [Habropoda laboriosa]
MDDDFLNLTETLNAPIRTIVSFTPKNKNPPIREPNMPEKQQKKEEKKEKKKKKPVIRMEDGIPEICQNNMTAEDKSNLHDNLDTKFRYHWGLRLPEEVANTQSVETRQMWNESINCVGDTNYSRYETSSTYDMDAVETMKNLQLSMSSIKDSEKKVPKIALSSQELVESVETDSSDTKSKDAGNTETLKEVLKTSSSEAKEGNVADEDYNVPNTTAFDAEISAWKDLVLKSKVPMDPSREEFLDPSNSRRADMLSIRPEPPEPKLDVQAVPSSNDELMKDEEEEPEVSKDLKGNLKATDVKRTSSPTDVQRTSSKKLHTGSFGSSKRSGVNGFQGRLKLHDSFKILEFVDNDVSFLTSEYSTSTESGWERLEQSASKGKGVGREELQSGQQGHSTKSQDLQENRVANVENLERNEAAREEQDMDTDFIDNMHAISDNETEISLNQKENQDIRENSRVSPRVSRKLEADDHMGGKFEEIQDNYDYSNSSYEDDFYPGYESMSLEPTTVTPKTEEQQTLEKNKMLARKAEQSTDRNEYVTEGGYIKWPGDPYPYSREHFHKWQLQEYDIHLGPSSDTDNELERTDVLNTPAPSTSSEIRVEMQPPARKMSFYARLRGSFESGNLSNVSDTLNLSNPPNPHNDVPSAMDTAQADSGATELHDSKKTEKKEKELPAHVETIQPDINIASHGVSTNIAKRNKKEKSKLVQQPAVVSLMLGDRQNEVRYFEDDIRSLRNQQLLLVKKEEIEKIYEMKNYAYLRPEQMKNLRLVSRSKPTPNNPTDINNPPVPAEST